MAAALAAPAASWAFPVQVAEAPSTSRSLTVGTIESARRSILLNIYELTSQDIADALIERIEAGVEVRILAEGQPVGGLSAIGRNIQEQLVQAMRHANARDRLVEMTSRAGKAKRRFRFNHGKYAVIDGERLLIGSENYSPTGQPAEGKQGNRGWEVVLHDAAIAHEYAGIFEGDMDPASGDLRDLTEEGVPCGPGILDQKRCAPSLMVLPFVVPGLPELDALTDWIAPWQGQETQYPRHKGRQAAGADEPAVPHAPWAKPVELDADSVSRISSPDTSLTGLLAMIRSAKRWIDLEQMSFDSLWGKEKSLSPLAEAVLEASRRGVRVRVLLNDESVFDRYGQVGSRKNEVTAKLLNDIARKETLPLKARIANLRKMGVSYIHNKGALIDGERTLVSSINWNNNSVANNREAAVLIQSREIHAHYRRLFESDWSRSEVRVTPEPITTR